MPPQSTLPGFMRLCGSSAALMHRRVSSPSGPSSSSSSARLPSPTPCSPVQVPPAASARLHGEGCQGMEQGHLSIHPCPHRAFLSPPAQALGEGVDALRLGRVLAVEDEDAVEVAVTHVSHHGACRAVGQVGDGREDSSPHNRNPARLTGEAGVLQVPLGLHHHVRQAGDGHTDVRGVALGRAEPWCLQFHRVLPPLSSALCLSLTWQPGRRAKAAYQALWRMSQSRPRSSGSSAQARPEPPFSRTISSASSQEPWNGAWPGPTAAPGTQTPQSLSHTSGHCCPCSWASISHPRTCLVPPIPCI